MGFEVLCVIQYAAQRKGGCITKRRLQNGYCKIVVVEWLAAGV